MEFTVRLNKYKGLLRTFAHNYRGHNANNSFEDLYQALSIKLWECHNRYVGVPDVAFARIFSQACRNFMASLYRSYRFQRDREVESLDAVMGDGDGKSREPSETEYSQEWYARNIERVVGALDKDTRVWIREDFKNLSINNKIGRNKSYQSASRLIYEV